MSADWQVGDLAVCVDASPPRDICGDGGKETNAEYIANLVEGRIYEVTQVAVCRCGGHIGLGNHSARAGGAADRFRKIHPDEPEPCEAEFITLLRRSRVSA